MVTATGGEVNSFMTISEIFCVLLSACALTGDLERTQTMGDLEAAKDAAGQVATLAQQTRSNLLLAHAELVQGQVKESMGEPDATHCFQSVLERLRNYEQSLLASRARLAMARLLRERAGRRDNLGASSLGLISTARRNTRS
jgi:hypothetical protein